MTSRPIKSARARHRLAWAGLIGGDVMKYPKIIVRSFVNWAPYFANNTTVLPIALLLGITKTARIPFAEIQQVSYKLYIYCEDRS